MSEKPENIDEINFVKIHVIKVSIFESSWLFYYWNYLLKKKILKFSLTFL